MRFCEWRVSELRDDPTRRAIEALHGVVDTDAVTEVWEESLQAQHGEDHPFGLMETLFLPTYWSNRGNSVPSLTSAVSALAILPAIWWTRGRGWALSQALIIIPYYRKTNPVLVDVAARMIYEVLADHKGAA